MEDEEIIKKRQRRKEVIEEERHNEIKNSLQKVAIALNQPKNDGVADAIKKTAEATKDLIQAVKDIPKPERPEVNVEISQKEIVTSLDRICDKIVHSNNQVVEAMKNKLMVDKFDIVKDKYGTLTTINVVYKPANQVTVKK